MRSRSTSRLALLALAALTTAVLVPSLMRKPTGSAYRGLTTGEWEGEIARCDVSPPPCGTGNGGRNLYLWRNPSSWERVRAAIGFSNPPGPLPWLLLEGDPAALPVLVELFGSPDPKARRVAIEGVRRIGDPAKGAAPLLVKALGDPDPSVSVEAAFALRRWERARVDRWLGVSP
jgi:hypothetical protein